MPAKAYLILHDGANVLVGAGYNVVPPPQQITANRPGIHLPGGSIDIHDGVDNLWAVRTALRECMQETGINIMPPAGYGTPAALPWSIGHILINPTIVSIAAQSAGQPVRFVVIQILPADLHDLILLNQAWRLHNQVPRTNPDPPFAGVCAIPFAAAHNVFQLCPGVTDWFADGLQVAGL